MNAFASTHHFRFLQRAAEAAQVGAFLPPVGGHSNKAMQPSTSPPNPNTSPKGGDGQATSRGSHSTPHVEQNTLPPQAVRTSSPPVEQQTNNLQHQLSALRRPASPTYTTSPRNTHWTETPRAASAYPPTQTSPSAVSTLTPAAKDDVFDWMLSPAGKSFMETKEGQAWLKTKAGVEWQKQKKEDEREEAEPGGYRLRDQQDALSVLQQKVRAQQDEIDKLKVCVCACTRVLLGCWGWHS